MSDLVVILNFLMLIVTLALLAVAFASALDTVQVGGWRSLLSGPVGWFHPPPGLDPEVWRRRRRGAMCFFGAVACLKLQIVLLSSL